jgi:hypothetical protein
MTKNVTSKVWVRPNTNGRRYSKVSSGASSSAPSWFTSMAELQWIEIAGGSSFSGSSYQKGSRLYDVKPNPEPANQGGFNAIMNAWTGAVAYQLGRQYILPCQGGHADWYGNEIYSLNLGSETPGWQRIWGPTPWLSFWSNIPTSGTAGQYTLTLSQTPPIDITGYYARNSHYNAAFNPIQQGTTVVSVSGTTVTLSKSLVSNIPSGLASNLITFTKTQYDPWGDQKKSGISYPNLIYLGYEDSSPGSVHGWHSMVCTTDGRIFMTMQNNSPGGENTSGVHSINVNDLDAGWTYHGRAWASTTATSIGTQVGLTAYDPITNKVYRGTEYSTTDGLVELDISTMLSAGGQDKSIAPQAPGSIKYPWYNSYAAKFAGWSVVLDDMSPRCLVTLNADNYTLKILNLEDKSNWTTTDNYGTNTAFVTKSISGWTTANSPPFSTIFNAVYHKASKSIIVGGCATSGSATQTDAMTFYKISLSGTNPLTATYTCSTVAVSGAIPTTNGTGYPGSYSKFQMIQDMGNGQSAIVMATNVNGPTYVMKIPTIGI